MNLYNMTRPTKYCRVKFACSIVHHTLVVYYRAVGAGLAGLAAAGPIFGELSMQKCRMNFGGLFNCCSKTTKIC